MNRPPRLCLTCKGTRIVWWTPLSPIPGRAHPCPHCLDWPVVESVAGRYLWLAQDGIEVADAWLDWSYSRIAAEVRQMVGSYQQLSLFDEVM